MPGANDLSHARMIPPHPRYSPPLALWCPYCHQPFVGAVDVRTGRFVHGSCPVGRLDLAAIRRPAADEWFWARFLERLGLPAATRSRPGAASRARKPAA